MQAENPLPDLGPWQVVEKLGEGGQCGVFRARNADSGEERAIKVMFDRSPNALDRFVAEAALLMQIRHPNVLKVYSLDRISRPPWIVMELLAGRDLDEERALDPIEPERAARLIADIANGLAEVHGMGVRHRDIKPANIMVGHDGVPRLIDFGIAREVSQAHMTQAGMVIGTVAYLPPELFDTDDPRNVQDSVSADVYALGQTLYEALIGEPAYPREGNTTKLLALVMREKLSKPCLDPREKKPQIPEELAAIVREATAREPNERIPSAAALEQKLRQWLAVRQDMNTAPVSRFDPSQLPPPPTAPAPLPAASAGPPPPPGPPKAPPATPQPAATGRVPRAANPSPPKTARTSSVSEPAAEPAPSGGFGRLLVWLASGVGTASALALIAIGTVVGLGALWVARPVTPYVDPISAAATVQEMLVMQQEPLRACALQVPPEKRKEHPQVVVRFDLVSGWPQSVIVESSTVGDASVEQCVAQGVQAMTFGGAPDAPMRVPFEMH